jgi:hypothetical protein
MRAALLALLALAALVVSAWPAHAAPLPYGCQAGSSPLPSGSYEVCLWGEEQDVERFHDCCADWGWASSAQMPAYVTFDQLVGPFVDVYGVDGARSTQTFGDAVYDYGSGTTGKNWAWYNDSWIGAYDAAFVGPVFLAGGASLDREEHAGTYDYCFDGRCDGADYSGRSTTGQVSACVDHCASAGAWQIDDGWQARDGFSVHERRTAAFLRYEQYSLEVGQHRVDDQPCAWFVEPDGQPLDLVTCGVEAPDLPGYAPMPGPPL